jgi:hypothetical protein
MTGFKTLQDKCGIYLTTSANTTCSLKNTLYPMSGQFNSSCLCGYTIATNGETTYHCQKNSSMIMCSATTSMNKNSSNVSLVVCRNGQPVDGGECVVSFTKQFLFLTLNVLCNTEVLHGDRFRMFLKSDENNTIITVKSAHMIHWCEKI